MLFAWVHAFAQLNRTKKKCIDLLKIVKLFRNRPSSIILRRLYLLDFAYMPAAAAGVDREYEQNCKFLSSSVKTFVAVGSPPVGNFGKTKE